VPTIVSGLIVYFDRSLGNNLLYRFERPQFADVRKMCKTGQDVVLEKEVSEVYGAEHLLRMLGTFDISVNNGMCGADGAS
jgi:mortality factor 4-like protein 1